MTRGRSQRAAFLLRMACVYVAGLPLWLGLLALQAQRVDPYSGIKPVEIVETLNDSAIIAMHLTLDLTVESLMEMLSEYESFDDSRIHYPKMDFTKKEDTSWLSLLPAYGQRYVHPFMGKVSSRFGPRWGKHHYGTDIKLSVGDSVRAAFDGVVRIARRNSSYGYIVVIRHYNGLETYYAHLSKMLAGQEQVVQAGDVVALGGNTGRSRGAHLHFEVRYLGAALNPEGVIDFESGKLRSEEIPISKYTFRYMKSAASSTAQERYHKVRSGETLSSIARKYATSVRSIQKLNRMRGTNIRAGSSLRVR